MRLSGMVLQAGLLLCTASSSIAASWTFSDGTVSVQGKGSGVGAGFKEKLSVHKAISKPVELGATDTLKLILTTQEGKTAKRPHQAFLLLKDHTTGLDISYPFSVKENGKAKVDLTQKDLPTQFLTTTKPIEASLVLASFGPSTPYNDRAFTLSIALDPNAAPPSAEQPLRYGKLPEINHIFKPNPKSPNILVTLIFTTAVIATLPLLVGAWLYLGANLDHLSKAFQADPVSHGVFVTSILGMEGVFFMYYTSWNLFKTLPVLAVVGTIVFLSGSRALTEVQERRFAGLR